MRRAVQALLSLALVVGPLAGCLGSDGDTIDLSVAEGSGDFVVSVLVTADGNLERTAAWWADAGQPFNDSAFEPVATMRGSVIKNDVVLDDDVPVLTDGERYILYWTSAEAGTVGRHGDRFEFFVLDRESTATLATVTLRITR